MHNTATPAVDAIAEKMQKLSERLKDLPPEKKAALENQNDYLFSLIVELNNVSTILNRL